MNLIKLQDEIAEDEGVKYETYRCSLGHLTGGIGHLVTEWDEEDILRTCRNKDTTSTSG
jgi:GH24 family phage-related lysozyme (muramidase)